MKDRIAKLRRLWLVGALLICIAVPAETAAAPTRQSETAIGSLSEPSLDEAVWTQLMADRHLDASGVVVTEARGIVELSGVVSVSPWRERAARIAALVRGVRGVLNRVRVEPVRRPDGVVARDVRQKLRATAGLALLPIQARVEDGVVELTGAITSWEEQQLAERVARGVPGVRFCQNQLTAGRGIRRTSMIVAGDVKSRLDWDPLLQNEAIAVVAQGMTVELKGQVSSAMRRRRAIRHAWVKGVRAVQADELVVKNGNTQPDYFRNRGPTDLEIRTAISDLATYWPQLPFAVLSTAVIGGVVTLHGNVQTLADKRAAEDLVRSAVGVVELKSELRGPWWRPPPAAPAPPPRRPVKRKARGR